MTSRQNVNHPSILHATHSHRSFPQNHLQWSRNKASRSHGNKWVRGATNHNNDNDNQHSLSSNQDQTVPPTTTTSKGRTESDTTPSTTTTTGSSSSTTRQETESSVHRPILKGPAPRMSWKRPRPLSSTRTTTTTTTESSGPPPTLQTPNQQLKQPVHKRTRTGNHTWRRGSTNMDPDAGGSSSSNQDQTTSPATKQPTNNGPEPTADPTDAAGWTRLGSHKLVHPKPHTAPAQPNEKQVPSGVSAALQPDLKRRGRHKLIAPTHVGTNRGKKKKIMTHALDTSAWKRKKKPRVNAASLKYAKRIRIAASATTSNEDEEETIENSKQVDQNTETLVNDGENTAEEDDDTPDSTAVLTTFAYCQPTRSKTFSHPALRKRRLIRVPTTDTTRICPMFAKGMKCTKEDCLLRHDVPSEAARPTCYYFVHHNGMCLNENCPFRHVKSSSTEPCPRFAQTGYCTLKDCTLPHVYHKNKTFVVNHSNSNNNKTSSKSNDTKGVEVETEPPLVFYDD